MCRWVVYFGRDKVRLEDVIVRPKHSLFAQAKHGGLAWNDAVSLQHLPELLNFMQRNNAINVDGFGVAFFVDDEKEEDKDKDEETPCGCDVGCFKSVLPICNSETLRSLARVLRSSRFLAHVRAASPGTVVSEANCHPFIFGGSLAPPPRPGKKMTSAGEKSAVLDCSPVLVCMHNGSVAHHGVVRRTLIALLSEEAFQQMRGTTDSELLGALCFTYLRTKHINKKNKTKQNNSAKSKEEEDDDDDAGCNGPFDSDQLLEALQFAVGCVMKAVDDSAPSWKQPPSSSLNLCLASPTSVATLRFRNSPLDPPTLYYQIGKVAKHHHHHQQEGGGVVQMDKKKTPPSSMHFATRCNSFRLKQMEELVELSEKKGERSDLTLVVASEPFLNDDEWHCVPRNTALGFDRSTGVLKVVDFDIPNHRHRMTLRSLAQRARERVAARRNK